MFKPTQEIIDKAQGVLDYVAENGWGTCGTDVGKQRANDLAKGRELSLDVVKRVYSYLARASEYYDGGSYEKCGNLMYDAWGGKPAYYWSKKIVQENKSMDKVYTTKNTSLELKDVDTEKGTVAGYFSAFDNVDSQGDIMRRGSYAKSIQENGPMGKGRIGHLYMHDPLNPIGKITELKEDDFGLYFESKMSKRPFAQDVLTMYQEGIIKEHSVGFVPLVFSEIRDVNNKLKGYEITETKLREGSSVVFGANENTPFVGMKSLEEIEGRMEVLESFIKGANVTDTTFVTIENELSQLKALINTLVTKEPSKDTPKDEPLNVLELWKSINV